MTDPATVWHLGHPTCEHRIINFHTHNFMFPIIEVTGTELKQLSESHSTPIIVAIISKKCSRSTKMMSVYREVGQTSENQLYVMYSDNDAPLKRYHTLTTPEIHAVYNGFFIRMYDGNRSSRGIVEWICNSHFY